VGVISCRPTEHFERKNVDYFVYLYSNKAATNIKEICCWKIYIGHNVNAPSSTLKLEEY